MVGRLQRVPLRDVWKHEALDFTRWLEANIDVLNEVVDLELYNVVRERSVGTFNADLVAEDVGSRIVIIENQLEKNDHDHLGKLLTYATSLEASAAVWIVAEPRPEHVSVISWLNESTPTSFYLVKVEALRIGESEPAPLLTLIVGPSEEAREVGDTKMEIAERHHLRHRFWTELLKRAVPKTRLHSTVSPTRDNWINAGSGRSGVHFSYVIRMNDAHVELAIESASKEENDEIFHALQANKDGIEERFGEALEWDHRETRKKSKIAHIVDRGGLNSDEEDWPALQDEMIDAMTKLEAALRPYLDRLRV